MKRNGAIWLAVTILMFWTLALPAQYQTTGGGLGTVGLREFCTYQFGDDGDQVRKFAEDQGFVFWEIIQDEVSSTTTPNVSIADAISSRGYKTDFGYLATHGNFNYGYNFPEGIAVEGYISASLRNEVFDYYVDNGIYSFPEDIYKIEAETYPNSGVFYYLIGVTQQLMLSCIAANNLSFELRGTCESSGWVQPMAAMGIYTIAYDDILPNDTAFDGADTAFIYLNGERGRTHRTTSEAASMMVDGWRGHWYYYGPANVVASPAVMAVYPDSGYVFNTDSFQGAYFEFDTPVEPYWDLEDMLGITTVEQGGIQNPYADLTNFELVYDGTRLQFDLENIRFRSDMAVWVDGLETKGAGSADRFLDGNTDPWGYSPPFYTGINCRPPNGDDYVVHWVSNVGEDPASTVIGFLAEFETDGVHLRWATESEFNTAYYEVCKWVKTDSTWQPVGEIAGSGNPGQGADYQLIDSAGQVGDRYRLFEIEEDGDRLPYGQTEVLAELPQTIPCTATTPQVQNWYKPEEYAGIGRGSKSTEVEALHICPAAWVSTIQPLVYHQLNYRGLNGVEIVTLEEIGPNPTAEDIRNLILQYDESLQYVQPWGVANCSDPEEEVIPGYYNPYDFGWWDNKYWFDEPFVDRDGDGWADLFIGRMQAKTLHDVEVEVDKSITYDYTVDASWRRQALFLCGDRDYGNCTGQLARQINDDLVSLVPHPLNGMTETLYWSELPANYWAREDATVWAWNNGAHLICTTGTVSTRTCLVDGLSYYFNPEVLDRLEPNGAYPIVLAHCCGTAGFGDGQSPYGPDLAYDMLTADWKGALIWLGYSENTSQPINGFMAREFLSRLDMNGTKTVGEIWLEVKQVTRQEHPEASDQNHMWLLLGDPTIRIRWTDIPTGIPDEGLKGMSLAQNSPNPFNPTTTISFSLAVDCPTKLAVYNVAGRKVAQLVDDQLKAGEYQISWDGSNHHGQRVASGVYFYCLETPNLCLNRKMTIIK